jgi:hypothetical protein
MNQSDLQLEIQVDSRAMRFNQSIMTRLGLDATVDHDAY